MNKVNEIKRIVQKKHFSIGTEIKKNKYKLEIEEKRGYQLLTADQYSKSFVRYGLRKNEEN